MNSFTRYPLGSFAPTGAGSFLGYWFPDLRGAGGAEPVKPVEPVKPATPARLIGPRFDSIEVRRAERHQTRHRQEYAEAVLSEPGEDWGANSYPVPWMWSDIYRHAPSELGLIPTADPDGAAYIADWSERYANYKGHPSWTVQKIRREEKERRRWEL